MYEQHSIHGIGRAVRAVSIAAGVTFLAACGGGSSGSGSGSGSLSLGVTDAPVDNATEVVVEFSSVTLKPKDGEAFTIELDPAQSIDLLDQQNGDSKLLLDDEQVTAGGYNWIRLGVNEGVDSTYIVIDSTGGPQPLDVPSSQNSGLKLVSGFTVAAGGSVDLTIDFDLRKSVVEAPEGQYKLRPALRLANNDNVGQIAVSATETYVSGNQCGSSAAKNAVYVFEGDVTPDDVDGNDPDPITTVLDSDDSDGAFTGTAAFLEPGTYTVAYVCDAEDDQPTTEENLNFSDVRNVDVEAGETAEYNLPLP